MIPTDDPPATAGVFPRDVRYPLTEAEWRAAAEQQADLHRRRQELKEERRTAMAGFREKFAGVDDLLAVLADQVHTGERVVAEDHERVLHPDRPCWQIIRLRDHQIVDEQPMNADDWLREKNRPLPLHLDAPEPDDRPAATVLAFTAPGTNGAGGYGDPEAVGKDAALAKREIHCPFILEEGEEPAQDQLCGAEGSPRRRGMCEPHYAATGGKDGGERQARMILRRATRTRQRRAAEDAAAGAHPEPEAAADQAEADPRPAG